MPERSRHHLAHRTARGIGIEQAMQMNDKVTHVGIVDGLLRPGLPRDVGAGIVRKNTDDIDLVEIPEFVAAKLSEFSAQDEMQQLFFGRRQFYGHRSIPAQCPVSGVDDRQSSLSELGFSVAYKLD